MTKPTQSSDEQLKQLYQKRKLQHAMPADQQAALQQQLRAVSRRDETQRYSHGLLATAAVVVFSLLLWVGNHTHRTDVYQVETQYSSNNQRIEVHSISQSKDHIQVATQIAENKYYLPIKQPLEKLKSEITAKKAQLEQRKIEYARIAKVGSSVEIITCNDQLLRLSENLVRRLKQQQAFPEDLQSGEVLKLVVADNGQITGVLQDAKLANCPS